MAWCTHPLPESAIPRLCEMYVRSVACFKIKNNHIYIRNRIHAIVNYIKVVILQITVLLFVFNDWLLVWCLKHIRIILWHFFTNIEIYSPYLLLYGPMWGVICQLPQYSSVFVMLNGILGDVVSKWLQYVIYKKVYFGMDINYSDGDTTAKRIRLCCFV